MDCITRQTHTQVTTPSPQKKTNTVANWKLAENTGLSVRLTETATDLFFFLRSLIFNSNFRNSVVFQSTHPKYKIGFQLQLSTLSTHFLPPNSVNIVHLQFLFPISLAIVSPLVLQWPLQSRARFLHSTVFGVTTMLCHSNHAYLFVLSGKLGGENSISGEIRCCPI